MTEKKIEENDSVVQTVKGRIKRIARHNEKKVYNPASFDEKHVNIAFNEFPRVAEVFNINFDSIGKGCWTTTPVKYISFQDGKIVFGTDNSVYEIIDGWDNV